MKIGINQPNGFTTNFGNDPSKYIDTKQPSNLFLYLVENAKNRFNPYQMNYGTVVAVAG